jgi:hypothetical protein
MPMLSAALARTIISTVRHSMARLLLKGRLFLLATYSFPRFIQSFVSNAYRGDRSATLRHFTAAIETQTSSLSLRA